MKAVPLPPLRRLLDPRTQQEAASRPIRESVNIPLEELPRRMHELPAKRKKVWVAGEAPAACLDFLHAAGREAQQTNEWSYGDATPGRLWEPNAFLGDILPSLVPGSALDIGCGSGREAILLASEGWRVEAVDVLPDALDKGRELAHRYIPDERENIRWVVSNASSMDWTCPPDLLTMFYFLDRAALLRIARHLKPGGSVVIETFSDQHRQMFGKPGEDRVLHTGELETILPDFHVLRSETGLHGDRHTVRFHAVK